MGCEESMAARNSWGLRSPSSSRSSWGSRSPWSPMIGEGGGSPALCRCRTGQLAAMKAAKCGMFSAYLRHNFRPVTHCGMVVKR